MFNPYKQLERVAGFRGFPATLTKRDGTELTLSVKAEELRDERVESSYPNALRVRAWSAYVDAFITETGGLAFPADGDRLTVRCRDGKVRVFATAREATTSRYWNWRYSTPGGRIVFYTKTEGVELSTTENGILDA